nr:MAG TPA: hypothetical protein [Caudoviricetes sp.]
MSINASRLHLAWLMIRPTCSGLSLNWITAYKSACRFLK